MQTAGYADPTEFITCCSTQILTQTYLYLFLLKFVCVLTNFTIVSIHFLTVFTKFSIAFSQFHRSSSHKSAKHLPSKTLSSKRDLTVFSSDHSWAWWHLASYEPGLVTNGLALCSRAPCLSLLSTPCVTSPYTEWQTHYCHMRKCHCYVTLHSTAFFHYQSRFLLYFNIFSSYPSFCVTFSSFLSVYFVFFQLACR